MQGDVAHNMYPIAAVYQIVSNRDGPNVRLWHSAEAEGLGRLTERVPNVRPNVVC